MISHNEKRISWSGSTWIYHASGWLRWPVLVREWSFPDSTGLQTHLGLKVFDLVIMCRIMRDEVRCSVTRHARQRWPGRKHPANPRINPRLALKLGVERLKPGVRSGGPQSAGQPVQGANRGLSSPQKMCRGDSRNPQGC